jgi:prophage regulatory protein
MAHKILRLPDVIDRVGFSRSTIYAFVSGGYFPPPIKIGPRAVGWLDADINAWIGNKIDKTPRDSKPRTAARLQSWMDGGAK